MKITSFKLMAEPAIEAIHLLQRINENMDSLTVLRRLDQVKKKLDEIAVIMYDDAIKVRGK